MLLQDVHCLAICDAIQPTLATPCSCLSCYLVDTVTSATWSNVVDQLSTVFSETSVAATANYAIEQTADSQ